MTPHELLANFQTLAEAPKGIQRLRELVLELAVRGKLVEQDPGDEPADALMACLKKERAKLVREGRIRAGRALADLEHVDCPFVVPKGWAVCRMTDLGFFLGGKTPSTNVGAYWDGTIPWVSPKDMKVPLIEDTEDHVSQKAIDDGLPLIPQGSVLIVVRSGILRRMVPVAITLRDSTINQDLKALWPFPSAKADYIALMIKGFESYILENLTKTGTTVESMKFEEFSAHPFLFPPEKEQRRIVARVDELMALLDYLEANHQDREAARTAARDSALAALREAATTEDVETAWLRIQERFTDFITSPEDVECVRGLVSQLAITGRMTPLDPSDESVQKLFARIDAERIQYSKLSSFRAPAPHAINAAKVPFPLPYSWRWARLGSVFIAISDGDHLPPPRSENGIAFLTIGNTSSGELNFTGCRQVKESYFQGIAEFRKPKRGDILYTVVGATYGRPVLVTSDRPFCVQRHIAILKPSKEIDPEFLMILLQSPFVYDQASSSATGTAQPTVPLGALRNFLVPIPPVEEQRRILKKVRDLMVKLDHLAALQLKIQTEWESFASAAVHYLDT